MKKNDEFYVGYLDSIGTETKKSIKRFIVLTFGIVIIAALIFGFSQKAFKNSSFELSNATKITGIYHENPYPMLRVEVAENTYKNILLLGFGKSSANPFLEKIRSETPQLSGKRLTIEGNLIYYNGKTLIQITDSEKVTLNTSNQANQIPIKATISEMTLEGEIIDPKCYFGVMKPGFGKIHRSCAVRCISGGIPPVLATSDENNISEYYLITDEQGKAIHKDILAFIGKPSKIKGIVEKIDDWYLLKINTKDITLLNKTSTIY
jgi:hypothetical protein